MEHAVFQSHLRVLAPGMEHGDPIMLRLSAPCCMPKCEGPLKLSRTLPCLFPPGAKSFLVTAAKQMIPSWQGKYENNS